MKWCKTTTTFSQTCVFEKKQRHYFMAAGALLSTEGHGCLKSLGRHSGNFSKVEGMSLILRETFWWGRRYPMTSLWILVLCDRLAFWLRPIDKCHNILQDLSLFLQEGSQVSNNIPCNRSIPWIRCFSSFFKWHHYQFLSVGPDQ